jgi:hypothetical protein
MNKFILIKIKDKYICSGDMIICNHIRTTCVPVGEVCTNHPYLQLYVSSIAKNATQPHRVEGFLRVRASGSHLMTHV